MKIALVMCEEEVGLGSAMDNYCYCYQIEQSMFCRSSIQSCFLNTFHRKEH